MSGITDIQDLLSFLRVSNWPGMAADAARGLGNVGSAVAHTLSPIGESDDGNMALQIPPMLKEPVIALMRQGEATRLPGGRMGVPDPANPENQADANMLLQTMFGGNALNPVKGGVVRTAERVATHDMPLFDMSEGRNSQTLNGSHVRYGVDDRGVYVYDLETPQAEAGRGQARSLMEGLTRSADDAGLPITLDAQPWGETTNGNQLRNFYRSLGFEPVDSDGMMRRNALLSDTGKPSIMGSALAGAEGNAPIRAYRGVDNAEHFGGFGSNAKRLWMSDDPVIASQYAPTNHGTDSAAVFPLDVSFQNPMTIKTDRRIFDVPMEHYSDRIQSDFELWKRKALDAIPSYSITGRKVRNAISKLENRDDLFNLFDGWSHTGDGVVTQLQNAYPEIYKSSSDVLDPQYATLENIISDAVSAGHDGIIFNGVRDTGIPFSAAMPQNQLLALQPNTVRSATTGETLFSDTGRPSILGSAIGAAEQPRAISNIQQLVDTRNRLRQELGLAQINADGPAIERVRRQMADLEASLHHTDDETQTRLLDEAMAKVGQKKSELSPDDQFQIDMLNKHLGLLSDNKPSLLGSAVSSAEREGSGSGAVTQQDLELLKSIIAKRMGANP